MVCDESNLSCVICFWSDKHLAKLDSAEGKVLAILAARVSDFSHKSLNASEDSRVFVDPEGFGRVDELRIWYDNICSRPEKIDFHALSGSLNVETHGTTSKENELANNLQNGEVNIKDFLKRGFSGRVSSENPEDSYSARTKGGLIEDDGPVLEHRDSEQEMDD